MLNSLLSLTLQVGPFPDKDYLVVSHGKDDEHAVVDLVEERFAQVGVDMLDVTYARVGNALVFETLSGSASVTVCRIAKGERDAMEELCREYQSDWKGDVDHVHHAM